MDDLTRPGEFDRRVEMFKHATVAQDTGERKRTDVSLGKRWVKRIEVSGSEEEEGKVMSLSVLRYRMRFEKDVLINGESYFFRDVDGEYRVNSVSIFGRNRELELKCSRRGKD